MHDKPRPAGGPDFAIPDYRVVELDGRDAAGFAQAQFMNDVAALGVGQWHWSGWLTPKGRVIALFAVIKLSDDRLWLLLADADPTAVVQALLRYVFRSKVGIRLRDELHVGGCFSVPLEAVGNAIAGNETGGIQLDLSAEGGPRTLFVGTKSIAADPIGADRWRTADIEHGLPRLPASQLDHWTPQQLSLDRLNAFSIRKGCYPGQEIVARTHFLGKVKRGLVLIEGSQPLQPGAELRGPETALGTLVASASDGTRHLALAVVPIGHDANSLSVDGSGVREMPLKGGLAR